MTNVTVWLAVVAHEDRPEASILLLPFTVIVCRQWPDLSTAVVLGHHVEDHRSIRAHSRAGFRSIGWSPARPLPDLGLLQCFQADVAGVDSDSIVEAWSTRRLMIGVVESYGNGVAAVVGFAGSANKGHAMWPWLWCWGSGHENSFGLARYVVGIIKIILENISVRISDGDALT